MRTGVQMDVRLDRQTDRQPDTTRLIVALRDFANAPKKFSPISLPLSFISNAACVRLYHCKLFRLCLLQAIHYLFQSCNFVPHSVTKNKFETTLFNLAERRSKFCM
jgi:hypothetical protein